MILVKLFWRTVLFNNDNSKLFSWQYSYKYKIARFFYRVNFKITTKRWTFLVFLAGTNQVKAIVCHEKAFRNTFFNIDIAQWNNHSESERNSGVFNFFCKYQTKKLDLRRKLLYIWKKNISFLSEVHVTFEFILYLSFGTIFLYSKWK